MKANKITIKKIRIGYLETMVTNLDADLDWKRQSLEEAKKELDEALLIPYDDNDSHDARNYERNVEYHRNEVERIELTISEGEKLLAELEKMV